MHSTKLLRKPLSHTNVLQRLIRMQSSALYITFNFCYRSIDKWYTHRARGYYEPRPVANHLRARDGERKKKSSGYVKDAAATVATIGFQMPQIRKEMPWNHFEIIRTNKFVDRFQLVGLCVPFFRSFVCASSLLDRLIGTRRHSALNTHTHTQHDMCSEINLRNVIVNCILSFVLHGFARNTPTILWFCVLSFSFSWCCFYPVQFGFCCAWTRARRQAGRHYLPTDCFDWLHFTTKNRQR